MFFTLLGTVACLAPWVEGALPPRNVHPLRPTTVPAAANAVAVGGSYPSGIGYGGGPVMLGVTPIHIVFYGAWTTTQQNIIQTFISDMSTMVDVKTTPDKWFNLMKTYSSDGTLGGTFIQGPITLGTSVFDSYSRGKTLTDADVWPIIAAQVSPSGQLPNQANAIYLLLTAADVVETNGFCSQWCGWHTYQGTATGNRIFSLVGNPGTQCPASCAAQTASSPNGDVGVDGMLSTIAHEIAEAMSDPLINAYGDSNGENGDKCAWSFGTNINTGSYKYNLVAPGTSRRYYIQQNWNAFTGACDTSASGTLPSPAASVSPVSPVSPQQIVPITVGSSSTTTKVVQLSVALDCRSPCGLGCRLNTDYPTAGDTFNLTSRSVSVSASVSRSLSPRSPSPMMLPSATPSRAPPASPLASPTAAVPITVGSSATMTKVVQLPVAMDCRSPCGLGCRLNTDYPTAGDTFNLTVQGLQLTVTRIDPSTSLGWGMNLIVPCIPRVSIPAPSGSPSPLTSLVPSPQSPGLNDRCAAAVPLSCGALASGSTARAVSDGQASCGVTHTSGQAWYYVDAPNVQLVASLCNAATTWDTQLSVFVGNSCGTLTCVGSSDDALGCGMQSAFKMSGASRYYIMVHGFNGASGNFALSLTCTPGTCPAAQAMTCNSTVKGDTSLAVADGTPTCNVSHSAPQLWFYVDAQPGQLVASTCNAATTWDTQLSVFGGSSCSSLNCLQSNDDSCGQQSTVSLGVTGGRYYFMVHGYSASSLGSFALTVTCNAPNVQPRAADAWVMEEQPRLLLTVDTPAAEGPTPPAVPLPLVAALCAGSALLAVLGTVLAILGLRRRRLPEGWSAEAPEMPSTALLPC